MNLAGISDEEGLCRREPDGELVLDAEGPSFIWVKSNHEVERSLPERMRWILQAFNLNSQQEIRVRCGQVQADDAGERELLPRIAGDEKVVLNRQVSLRGNDMVSQLSAGAGKFENPLMRPYDL
jgi:hypothetical protein